MHLSSLSLSLPHSSAESNAIGLTAVAVDRDKNSKHAVKWAVDHLLTNNPIIILIHVKLRAPIHHGLPVAESSPEFNREQLENEVSQVFLPYRSFCALRGIQLREVALEDVDVAKALMDYISANNIHNIVVGASNRNALTRKFRHPDVSDRLIKSAPDYCAVYVIAKGKAITVRSARSPVPAHAQPPRQSPIPSPRQLPDPKMDPDDTVRTPSGRARLRGGHVLASPLERKFDYMKTPPRDRPLSTARTAPNTVLLDALDSSFQQPRFGSRDFLDESDFQGSMDFGSMDFGDSFEFSSASNESGETSSSACELEAEMRRLKLELKQTMDMYNNACREAISAKQKARELHQWKMEEAQKFEELRQAEEAALALAEMEKARCKVALEAAEAAQRLAELEAEKRHDAELKAKHEAEEKNKALDVLAQNDLRYRKYSIEEIEVATSHFSETLKIGEGGYGPVYRALLDHTQVAIKVLRPDAAQGRKQFQQEVEVLSCIRHPNMVLLLGACPEYGCLVYEYMDNGSLDDRLFRRGNTPTIPWSVRFKIAAEIATGLLFLHQTKPEPLVHRDLKPANILLDRNYVSKISDVGLARLVPPLLADDVTQYRMTSTAGTFCYIDPEYQQTGMLGTKSDVYSLGIMLLQIITAKPPMGLTHLVERAIEKGTFAEVLDPTVTDWPLEEALAYAKLALKCAELRRKDRPDLGTVILPELNRFRNIGLAYEEAHGGGGPLSPGSMHPVRALVPQERATSHQNISGPWTSSVSSSTTDA